MTEEPFSVTECQLLVSIFSGIVASWESGAAIKHSIFAMLQQQTCAASRASKWVCSPLLISSRFIDMCCPGNTIYLVKLKQFLTDLPNSFIRQVFPGAGFGNVFNQYMRIQYWNCSSNAFKRSFPGKYNDREVRDITKFR